MAVSVSTDDDLHLLGHEAALEIGASLLDAGQSASAIPYLQHANALRPTAFGHARLGKALRDTGEASSAVLEYDKALTFEVAGSVNTRVRVGLAAALCDVDDEEGLERVGPLLEEVLAVEAQNAYAWNVMVRYYRRMAGQPCLDDSMRRHFQDLAERSRAQAEANDQRSPEDRERERRLRAVRAREAVSARLRIVPDPRGDVQDHSTPAVSSEAELVGNADRLSVSMPRHGVLRRFASWLRCRLR